MLIFILIDVQYLQKAAFSFEKGLNRQNHFPSPGKKNSPKQNFRFSSAPTNNHLPGQLYVKISQSNKLAAALLENF